MALAGLFLFNCSSPNESSTVEIETVSDLGSGSWINLLEGDNLNSWSTFKKDGIGSAWKLEDGVLHLDPSEGQGGDLVTKQSFGDFHLKMEWKISENGNSGVMFYVQESEEYNYPWETGPEMQLLDNDGHPDGKIITHRTGDLYDLIESSAEVGKSVGEWNEAEVISKDGKLEFYLNGTQTISTTLWDDNWEALVAGSKFKDMPGFGKFKEGKIALQDHGDKIWFRNVQIKEL